MKRKFKVGDRVQLKKKYIEWVLNWIPEGYSVSGVHKQDDSSDLQLFVLFASQKFNRPLRGKVVELKQDDPHSPTVGIEVKNEYGVYTDLVAEGNVIKLIKIRKCKNCGAKK